jgi:hypothetical protein
MTNLIKYSAVVLILTVSILIFEHFNTQAKIENFCEERKIPMAECNCVVDYIQKNTSSDIRKEFMSAIKDNQDFAGHPNLLLPMIAAVFRCKIVLEK